MELSSPEQASNEPGTLAHVLAFLVSIVPGILVNIQHGMQAEPTYSSYVLQAVGTVSSCLLAASCIVLHKSLIANKKIQAAICLLCLLGCLSFNARNAFNLQSDASAMQAHKKSVYAGLQKTVNSLQKREKDRLGQIGDITPGIVAAEIKTKKYDKLFLRSKSCQKATLSDSLKYCSELSALERKLAAAKDLQDIRLQIGLNKQRMKDLKVETEQASPAENNLKEVFGLSNWAAKVWNLSAFPLVLLTIEIFGPFVLLQVWPHRRRQPVLTAFEMQPLSQPIFRPLENNELDHLKIEEDETKDLSAESKEDFAERFIKTRLKISKNSQTETKEVYASYKAACNSSNVECLSITQFTPLVVSHGFKKVRKGKMIFENTELLPAVRLAASQ